MTDGNRRNTSRPRSTEVEDRTGQVRHSLWRVNKTRQPGVESRRNGLRQTVEGPLWRDKAKREETRREREARNVGQQGTTRGAITSTG